MPFSALSTFQINTNPFVKYDLKLLEPTENEIYTLTTRYRIYKFNQNGKITLGLDRLLTTDSLTNKLNYCVVGGGGGGSGAVKAGTVNGVDKYAYGSGGGGGQVKTGFVQICSSDNDYKKETVIITIGEGGAGSAKNTGAFYPKNTASSGLPSSISFSGYKTTSSQGVVTTVYRDTIIALGGAGGKTLLAGASGGGTSGGISNLNGRGGGGGGGSDLNKGDYGSINAGNGGTGTYNSVFNRCVGGGGGGGLSDYYISNGRAGIGGTSTGGGGNGGSTTEIAQPGYANYGGGGGGGGGGYLGNYDGAAGGSGVVFIWISY